jgi:hypothetical protein
MTTELLRTWRDEIAEELVAARRTLITTGARLPAAERALAAERRQREELSALIAKGIESHPYDRPLAIALARRVADARTDQAAVALGAQTRN